MKDNADDDEDPIFATHNTQSPGPIQPSVDPSEAERIVPLETAIARIKQLYETTQNQAQRPYFFMVGAGLSSPPIPTATAMTDNFRATSNSRPTQEGQPTVKLEPSNLAEAYSFWFKQAYPERKQQQEYFAGIIEDIPLSAANHRLAHLLLPERDRPSRLANLVITPNFDDYLFRALMLFGCQPAPVVCDHPATTERITLPSEKVQIVHLHGTYQHYDLANLPEKIAEAPMRELVRSILSQNWVPIVIGYSCWNDAFWQEFEGRLWEGDRERALPYTCFWFCFTRRSVGTLPERLRKHSQVVFVVPPAEDAASGTSRDNTPPPWSGAPGFSQKASDPTTLPATQVLDALIHMLGIGEPELTRNPIAFLVRHLGYSLPPEERSQAEPKNYFIARLQRQLREFEKAWTDAEEIIPGSKGVFSDMRSSRHASAIVKIAEICDRLITDGEGQMQRLVNGHGLKLRGPLRDLLDAAWSASIGILAGDGAQLETEGHKRVCQLGELIEKYLGRVSDGRDDEAMFEQMAKSGLYLAIRRIAPGTERMAIENLKSIHDSFSQRKFSSVQNVLAWGKLNQGAAYQRFYEFDVASACYDDCVRMCHENSLGEEQSFFVDYNRALIAAYRKEEDTFDTLCDKILSYVPEQNSLLTQDITSLKRAIAEIRQLRPVEAAP